MMALTANRGVFYGYKNTDSLASFAKLYLNLKVVKELFRTRELQYHWFYFGICILGLVGHDFLYCILVRTCGRVREQQVIVCVKLVPALH